MIAVQHIEHNSGSAHLVGNAEAARHGINYKCGSKAFTLHVFADGDRTYVDHRDIGDASALPFPRAELSPHGHWAERVEAENLTVSIRCGYPSGHHAVLDLVG